jgi:hypothetical protein
VAYTGKNINAYMTVAGNPECKVPLKKSRFRREDTNKNYLKQTGWVGLDWFHSIQDRDKKRTLLKRSQSLSFYSSSFSLLPPPLPFPQALVSIVELDFKLNASLFHPISGQFMPVFHSHYLQMLLHLTNPSFPWSATFPYSFHSDRNYCFWHSFFINPFNTSIPSLKKDDCKTSQCLLFVICHVYPYFLLYSNFLFFMDP